MPLFNPHHCLFRIAAVAGLAPRSCLYINRVIWLSSPEESLSIFSEEKVGGWMEGIMLQARLAHELQFGSSCCKSHRTDSQIRWKFWHWPCLTYFSCLLMLENKALDNYNRLILKSTSTTQDRLHIQDIHFKGISSHHLGFSFLFSKISWSNTC